MKQNARIGFRLLAAAMLAAAGLLGARANLVPRPCKYNIRITFSGGGGSGTMSSVTKSYDSCSDKYQYYALPACRFTRPGYTFTGWRVEGGCSEGEAVYREGYPYELCGEDLTVTATWTRPLTYVVRLHRNNSANDGATASRSFTVGTSGELPTISELGWTRTGYEFRGWGTYSSSSYASYDDGEWVYNLSSYDGATVHLYAIWDQKAGYTVRLHRNNSANDGATASRSFTVDIGRNLPTASELGWYRSGYSFAGWARYSWSTSAAYGDGAYAYNLSTYDGDTVDLYGVWAANAKYTVRLYRNNSAGDGASASRGFTVGVGRYLPTVSELGWSRPGYEFAGWGAYAGDASADYGDGEWVRDLASREGAEVRLYAIWRSNGAYVVRLHRNKSDDDGATAGRRIQIGTGRILPTLAELGWSRPGYDFAGWAYYSWSYYSDFDDGEYVSDLASSDGDEVHLYAVWQAKASYTVELHRNNSSNDGASATRSMIVDVARSLPTLASLGWTRAGYSFQGWSRYNWSSYASYADGQSVVNLSTTDGGLVDLYGVWAANAKYTVRLHRNNSSVDGATAGRTMTVGVSRRLPTIYDLGWSRPGYSFAGWGTYFSDTSANYQDGQTVQDLSRTDGAEVHLYAIWKINAVNYTVRLHRNNSSTDGATASRAFVTGTSRALPTVAALGWSRSGYEFVGWGTYQTDASANYSDGQSVANLTMSAGGVVDLYAIWRSTTVTYAVRLHRNNSADDGATASRALTTGKSRALPTISELGWTRAGYTFAGWGTSQTDTSANYSNGQSVSNLSMTQGAVVHLYAIWTSAVTYTVRLHRNNSAADGATASRSFTVGKSRALPTIQELGWGRAGYSFAGWATSQASHFTNYYDGQSLKDLSTRQGAVVHLYAVWY